jgi:hypothetical protein
MRRNDVGKNFEGSGVGRIETAKRVMDTRIISSRPTFHMLPAATPQDTPNELAQIEIRRHIDAITAHLPSSIIKPGHDLPVPVILQPGLRTILHNHG